MRIPMLNLARRPFTNSRPVTRLALVLWLVGGGLLVVNGLRYWQLLTGSENRGHELEALEARVGEHQNRIADLRTAIGNYDVNQQNAQVTFLNQKIAARTFGWSELFDRLEEVLPDDVRLVSLSPISQNEGGRRRNRASQQEPKDRFRLQLRGVAKTFDAELALIDSLFRHPSFSRPRLSRDQLNKVNQVEFEISLVYRPGPVPEPAAEGEPASHTVADTGGESATGTTTGTGTGTSTGARAQAPAATTTANGGPRGRGNGRQGAAVPPVAIAGSAGQPAAATPEPTPAAPSTTTATGLPPGLVSESQGPPGDDQDRSSRRRNATPRRGRNAAAGEGARTSVPSPQRPNGSTRPAPSQPPATGGTVVVPTTPAGSGSGPTTPGRPSPTTPVPHQPSASSALEPR